jgi:hypothetical protein
VLQLRLRWYRYAPMALVVKPSFRSEGQEYAGIARRKVDSLIRCMYRERERPMNIYFDSQTNWQTDERGAKKTKWRKNIPPEGFLCDISEGV